MNKPRAIGLIEGTIDGLTNIDRWGSVEVSQWINMDGCVKNLKEAIKLLESDKKKTCNDEMCGKNIYKFCPYCGGKIVEVKHGLR